MKFDGITQSSEINSIQNANNRKLMTSLPDPEHHFKFRNLMKNATFRHKNDSFHHLSEHYLTTLYLRCFI